VRAFPSLEGRWFALAPVLPEQHRQLYALAVADQIGFRWRFRGAVPPFGVFEQTLHQNVPLQLSIVSKDAPPRLVGLVAAYNMNFQDATTYVALVTDRRSGAGALEAFALFVRYLFRLWPLRKLYFELPEFNLPQFASAVRVGLLKEEGRLRGDRYFDGAYWDQLTLAMYPSDAEEFERRSGILSEPSPTDG
jgi:RimJ/RimL family protein N-acetyltransferase